MADPLDRRPDNAPGPVYVDDACICCQACIAVAPDHFDDATGDVVCYRQPTTRQAWEACRDAADACPVDAIGLG